MNHYWQPIERQWYEESRAHLAELEAIYIDAHEWLADFAEDPEFTSRRPSASVVIQRLLLRRLGEELRGVELLALNGHGFQAISATTNLLEHAHLLTYLSASEERAEGYRTWESPAKQVASVKDLIKKSGNERGWTKERIEQEHEKYRFLCGFKHNNSIMQRILLLPPPNDPDLVMGKFALAESVHLVLTAVSILMFSVLCRDSLNRKIGEVNVLLESAERQYPRLVGIANRLSPL